MNKGVEWYGQKMTKFQLAAPTLSRVNFEEV